MNVHIEIGPGLYADLERIAPGESPAEQICTALDERKGLRFELEQIALWFEQNAEALEQAAYRDGVNWQTPLANVNAALERTATPALACPSKEVES